MNHLGNDNKMVSDTPRMNSVAGHARGIVDAAILAEGMKLECELNAANDHIKRLEEFASRFLNPDDLGWAIGKYDRDEAREALGKERVESKTKESNL